MHVFNNNVTEGIKRDQCCGCGACYNRCPTGAISMKENEEGFLYPEIDESRCSKCGLCLKSCPVLNSKTKNTSKPECFAATAVDEVRMKSSSGGTFTVLAEYIIEKNGYVCGATFDSEWNVHHIIVDNKKDLELLRGSKYVQSNIENCYKDIKKLLEDDKYVLFSGCPCQVTGLYSFLGKNYEKLYTVDILCHGAPSPGVWQKYLKDTFDINKIKNINFRDKEKIGWSCSHCTFTMDSGEKIVSDEYTRLFHQAIIMRKSCEDCNFSKLPRPADISIGDFWEIDKYNPELNDHKGLSLVLVNSKKGEDLLEKIKDNLKINKIKLKKSYNNGHMRHGLVLNTNREIYFRNYKKLKFNKSANIALDNKYDVCLITTFFGLNYGAMLVAYAVHELISNLGYSVLMLQKPCFVWNSKYYGDTIPQKFAETHYIVSDICYSNNDLRRLNNRCENFVVGSDQIFNPGLRMHYIFLDWVDLLKNKVSFGTSFGHNQFPSSQENIARKQYQFDRFNHIALREVSKELCEDFFQIDAIEIADPTLLVSVDKYLELSKAADLNITKPYLLTYMLDVCETKVKAIRYIADKLGLELINISNLTYEQRRDSDLVVDKDYTLEEFLYLYQNTSFVITDSYHGTCFAVKFNKPFISIKNDLRGGLRYKVFDRIKVTDRIISDIGDIYNRSELLDPMDYTQTNQIIEKESKFAIEWLDDALKNNTSKEKFSNFEKYIDILFKEQSEINEIERFMLRKNQVYFNYYRCKFLSKVTFGKKRGHYKLKEETLHNEVRQIRRLKKESII